MRRLLENQVNNDCYLEFSFLLKQKRRKHYNIIFNSSLLLPNNPLKDLYLRISNLQIDQIHRIGENLKSEVSNFEISAAPKITKIK